MEINVDNIILQRRSFFSYVAHDDFDVLDNEQKKLFYIKRDHSFRPQILIFTKDEKSLLLKIKSQAGFSISDRRIYLVFNEVGNVICKIKGKGFLFSSWDVVDTFTNKILVTARHEYERERKWWKFLWRYAFFDDSYGKKCIFIEGKQVGSFFPSNRGYIMDLSGDPKKMLNREVALALAAFLCSDIAVGRSSG